MGTRNWCLVPIPKHISELHRILSLSADIMFVNKIPFMVSLSRGLKFQTVQRLKNRKIDNITKSIKRIVNLYKSRSFNISCIFMDREFEPVKNEWLEQDGQTVNMNTIGADDHVPEIERRIRMTKERVKATRSTLPYKKISIAILVEMVFNAVMWLNVFPSKNSLLKIVSPRTILTGLVMNWEKHYKIQSNNKSRAISRRTEYGWRAGICL